MGSEMCIRDRPQETKLILSIISVRENADRIPLTIQSRKTGDNLALKLGNQPTGGVVSTLYAFQVRKMGAFHDAFLIMSTLGDREHANFITRFQADSTTNLPRWEYPDSSNISTAAGNQLQYDSPHIYRRCGPLSEQNSTCAVGSSNA